MVDPGHPTAFATTSSSTSATFVPAPGGVLHGRWELVAPLGVGGSARVWRAKDRVRGEDVAVKLLVHEEDAAGVRRLLREGEALARVQHEGVVRVLDVVAGPPAALVLALVDAPSLRARLDDELLRVADVLRLAVDVAAALLAAHAQGVAHRDLKPENILVTPAGAVVVDFGLAAPVSAAAPPSNSSSSTSAASAPLVATMTTSIHGTPAYLAPELVEAGVAVDAAAADRYALGVVLLECLLGDNPYRAPTVAQTLARHVERTPPSPASARAPGEVPEHFAAVVVALLARAPKDRPPLTDVIAAARGERGAPLSSATARASTAATRAPVPTRTSAPFLAAAVVVSLVVALSWVSRAPSPAPGVASSSTMTAAPSGPTPAADPAVISVPAALSARTTPASTSSSRLPRSQVAPAAAAGVAVGAATSPAPDAPPAMPGLPTPPVGLPAKRQALRERCAHLPCASLADAVVPVDLVALRRYRTDIDACLARCF